MARARAIETRLEKLIPALDEYFTVGFLTREESLEVSRQRTHWEYRLVAKPLLLLDVQDAVKYELGLEERLRLYCVTTKVSLKHRWSIVERVESIYKIGLKNLRNPKERETLRRECVLFMKHYQLHSSLSKLYAELLIKNPTRADVWVEAAEWESLSQRNVDNGRAIAQQALVTMAAEPQVWACALKIELHFAARLLHGLIEERKEELHKKDMNRKRKQMAGAEGEGAAAGDAEDGKPSEKLRAENAAMGSILLDLALAQTVVQEALTGPASSPALASQLLCVAGEHVFAAGIVREIVTEAAQKMFVCVTNGEGSNISQKVQVQWREGMHAVCRSYLTLPDILTNRFAKPLCSAVEYLDNLGVSVASVSAGGDKKLAQQIAHQARDHAAMSSLLSLIAFVAPTGSAAKSRSRPASLSFSATSQGVVEGTCELLKALVAVGRAKAVSRVSGALMRASQSDSSMVELAQVADWLCSNGGASAEEEESETKKGKRKAAKRGAGASQEAQQLLAEAEARAEALFHMARLAASEAAPSRSKAKTEGESHEQRQQWPVQALGRFLLAEDRDVLREVASSVAGVASSGSALSPARSDKVQGQNKGLTEDEIEGIILWLRKEEMECDAKDEKALAASKARRVDAVIALLRRHRLISEAPASASISSSPIPAAQSPGRKRTSSAEISAQSTEAERDVLLLRKNAIDFTTDEATPVLLWRLYNALEVIDSRRPAPNEQAGSSFAAVASSSDSDSDSDEGDDDDRRRMQKNAGSDRSFSNYAAAGMHFLAGVSHGSLSTGAEWERVEGISALFRSHLHSLTGLKRFVREELVTAMKAAGAKGSDAWVTDMQELLSEARRCQPLPRHCLANMIIPFLEAVAVYSRTAGTPSSAAESIKVARAAHETVLALYGFTKHLEFFAPVVYEGKPRGSTKQEQNISPDVPRMLNAVDWVAYATFEREVVKDLVRSKAVVERARRFALAPQILLVKLSNSV